MGSTTDFRNGLIIRFNGALHQIVEWRHHKPGKGGAMVLTKLKNLRSGSAFEQRFRPGESVDIVRVERRKYQFLYPEGEDLCFMDQENYDERAISKAILGDKVNFLKDNIEVTALSYKDDILAVNLPNFVVYKITDSEPGVKGDTAKAGTKPAKIETGAIIQVPLFVNEGDSIKVDTRTGSYLERAAG